jgi:hypothetical protein
VVLVKADLTDRKSPLARQAMNVFRVSAIPDVRVYGTDGREIGRAGPDLAAIEALIRKQGKE